MDSIKTKNIDKIFLRLQQTIDISKIENKRKLFREITRIPTNKYWSVTLNDYFWNIVRPEPTQEIKDFSRIRGITLSADITGKIERWVDNINRLVIRDRGKFKAHKRVFLK